MCSPEFKGHGCTEGKTVYVMAPLVDLSGKEQPASILKCAFVCQHTLLFLSHQRIITAWEYWLSYSDIDCYFLDLNN